ncbi:hypothetical protein Bca4012_078728 [Brassica carinata]|uniref:(rape) hypothetical protein n=1 Tax=Brassica napus TaxID=3708 RepID=A0A078I323_BRANA|nr:unnamed protein product [Brassica napus]CDY44432.1 BnaC07g24700D [Brassica napus]
MEDHLASGSVDPVVDLELGQTGSGSVSVAEVRRSCSVSLPLPLLRVPSPLVSISPSFVRSVRTSPSQSSSDLR